MSGLAALLAGHVEAGVWRWAGAAEPADVRHTVEYAGWRFGHVDGWTLESKPEVLAAVAEALEFPAYFGKNLDALVDCLRDVAEPTVLLWDGWSPFARSDEHSFRAVLEIAGERAAAPPPFAVLLRGAGPELTQPLLD